jgi:hypothetical protein
MISRLAREASFAIGFGSWNCLSKMILSPILSSGRSGAFLDRKLCSSICSSIPAGVSWHLDTYSSLEKNRLVKLSTQDRISLLMPFVSFDAMMEDNRLLGPHAENEMPGFELRELAISW